MSRRMRSCVGAALLILGFTGCGESVDPEVASLQKQLVLSTTPGESKSISSIRTALAQDGAEQEIDVVIRGRINAGDLPPWEPDQAAFILTDATGHEGEKDHDPHTCPFCSRSINDYLAKVRFHQPDGSVVGIDSRTLFDVQEKQLVVITGKASIDSEDLLAVSADGIYVVR